MASAVARARHERRRDTTVIGVSSATPAVGGAALLTSETDGFAVDFDWPVDAQRVAVKTAGTVVSSGLSFLTAAPGGWKVTPASINYSATAGSWVAHVSINTAGAGTSRIIGYTTGSYTPIYIGGGAVFMLYDGVSNIGRTVGSVLGSHKLAVAFASGDRALTADGLAVSTDAAAGAAFLSPGTFIFFGSNIGTDVMDGSFHKIVYVPRRMSNAELQTMTA